MSIAMRIGRRSLLTFLALSTAWTAALCNAEEPPREPLLSATEPRGGASVISGSEGTELARFAVRTKKSADRVEVHVGENATVFAVHSPSGIGGATITLVKEPWPENVAVCFYLRGLESFSISHGKMQLTGSVLSHSGNPSRLELSQDGEERKQRLGTSIGVFDSRGKPAQGLPGEGGYFEIALPKALFEGQSNSLTLHWIDFYRG